MIAKKNSRKIGKKTWNKTKIKKIKKKKKKKTINPWSAIS